MIKNKVISLLLNLQLIGIKIFKMTKSVKENVDTKTKIGDVWKWKHKPIVMTEFGFHKSREQKNQREYLKNDQFRNDIMITANTYSTMTYDKLNVLLRHLSNKTNYKLNRYYRKQPHRRVKFHCFNEFKDRHTKRLYGRLQVIPPNTHSHIIAEVPKEFDMKKVIRLLKKYWHEYDQDKYDLHTELKRSTSGRWHNICYATKQYIGKATTRSSGKDDTVKHFIC
jgi:hypothetical protein